MITTVNQGLHAYKNEVQKYKKFLDGLDRRYPGLAADNVMGRLSTPDYNQLLEWNHKLAGMRLALGLTKAEDKAIDAEFGIPTAA